MEIIKFKTNIERQEDITKVSPYLEQVAGITNWKVDPDSNENILSVSGKDLDPQAVENAVQQAGYHAEILRVLGLGGQDL